MGPPRSAFDVYRSISNTKAMKGKIKKKMVRDEIKKSKKQLKEHILGKKPRKSFDNGTDLIDNKIVKRTSEHLGSRLDQSLDDSDSERWKINEQLQEQDRQSVTATDHHDGLKAFKWMVAPIDEKDFFAKYWETKPLYLKRRNTNYYKHILSSEKLDKMIRGNSLYYTRNVDVVTYENGQRETHNPEGRAVPSDVWDYYQNGCSVRILNPQTYSSKIQLLLSTLQEYFGTMVGANVYLTPPGSQGFAPHYDDIEAFILQLEGRKHWKLYMPRNKNEFLARNSSHNLTRDELGELIEEITLEAGSLLYFPRGIVHEAYTDANSHSLHITVSAYQCTSYADLLEKVVPAALKEAAKNDVQFRRGLPLHYLKDVGAVNKDRKTELRNAILNTVDGLIHKLTQYVDVDAGADQLGRKYMFDAVPPVFAEEEKICSVRGDGEYLSDGKVHNRIEFTPDTKVRLLRYHCLHLVTEEGQDRIYYCSENSKVYHGEEEQFLDIDIGLVPLITHLKNSFPKFLPVESLAGNDEMLKLQAVSQLWERGLLVTEERLEILDSDKETEHAC